MRDIFLWALHRTSVLALWVWSSLIVAAAGGFPYVIGTWGAPVFLKIGVRKPLVN